MIKELVPRSRYGPPGLAERVYEDLYGPYGPNAIRSQPPQFLRTRSAEGFAKGHRGYGSVRTLAVAGRIQTPPHDMTAAQPHPSGHSLSFTGTWRASGKEHQDSGMSSARECVHRLLTGTTPATASRPAVRTQIVPRSTANLVGSDRLSYWCRRCFRYVALCYRLRMATRPYTRRRSRHRRCCELQTSGHITTESTSMPRRSLATERESTTAVVLRHFSMMCLQHRLAMCTLITGRLRRTAPTVQPGCLERGGSESRLERLQRCDSDQHWSRWKIAH